MPDAVDSSDAFSTVEAIHRIKEEIDQLTEQQAEALKSAIYVGMTPAEAKEYDGRRIKITKLIKEMALLEAAQ